MSKLNIEFAKCVFAMCVIAAALQIVGKSNHNTPEPSKQIDTVTVVDTVKIAKVTPPKTKKKKRTYSGDMQRFLTKIAKRESGNRHTVVNKYGMLGKYQFSPNTLRRLGFEYEHDQFLANPELQDQAMIKYLKTNAKILKTEINTYDGTYFNGVYVTKSGILAAAHLVGAGAVRKYFKGDTTNVIIQDANGTHLEHYLQQFAGYKLAL